MKIFPQTLLGRVFLLTNIPVFLLAGWSFRDLGVVQVIMILSWMFVVKMLGFGEGKCG